MPWRWWLNGAGEPGILPDLAVKIVTDAAAAGKPIAPTKTGLFKERRYANRLVAPLPGGIQRQEPVVRVGNIITTAVCPNAASDARPDTTVPLIKKLIEAVG